MPALPDPLPPPADAALRVEYRQAPLDALLADPRLLAVTGFGADAPATHADPRYLRVALPVHGAAPFECWFVDGDVRHGRDDGIAWSEGGGLRFGALEVGDEGDAETAGERAYARLQAWLARDPGHAHPLRIWNYLDAITEGEGDDERYRRFCVGRARGIGRTLAPGELPAATAIGHPARTGRFQLYWLAASAPGTPLENPRQVQAWRYPRQYGPTAPTFARGMRTDPSQLLISGTAAVVGHASLHHDDLDAQVGETLANLDSLLAQASMRPPRLGAGSLLKAYLRDVADAEAVATTLRARFPTLDGLVLLGGDICRSELLVEIDGVHHQAG